MFGFGGGGGGGGGFFGGGVPGRFDHQYQCFPVSFIGREDLEKGNKIILPPSALDHLARLNISYPMLFEVSNPNMNRRTHCGVLEFIAEEGTCYLPYWIMCNLLLQEGDIVRITNTTLPKGSFVKLQPVSKDFLDIHNPRAVLENTLRNFATLTVGDCIVIMYNNKKYEIEIIETKPASAISIIEADVNVDFAPPKDYVEPERQMPDAGSEFEFNQMIVDDPQAKEEAVEEKKDVIFSGAGQRLDGKPIKASAASPGLAPAKDPRIEDDDEDEMPWRKRIPGGVKWTKPPYMFGMGTTGVQGKPVDPASEQAFKGDGKSLQ